ncbi:MAG: hypothetical protein KBD55_02875 [Candidatus Pacebacteria bacterium]|jgi:hypothetical protein|nr:hypothetical protein [Candidatus Paceibacterota bacterium]
MKKIIHNLRQQPEEVRRHVLHVFVAIVGLIFLLFWVYSLGYRINDTKEKASKEVSPLNVLKANIEIPQQW